MIPRALCLLLSAALLTSCASPETRVAVEHKTVVLRAPEALRTCAADPEAPDPATATSYDVAALLVQQKAALDDCQDTLAERNAWEDEAAARIEAP